MSDSGAAAKRAAMYGDVDLGSFELFSGNFINYGYWESVPDGRPITLEERTESQAALYRKVVGGLGVTGSDAVLEVGCGIGVGAALTLREFRPGALVGLDFSEAQLERARARNEEQLDLRQGDALDMPFEDNSFDKLYTVEVAQHFEDLAAFAAEAHRVLRPGGKLSLATFFATTDEAPGELRSLIETIDDEIDFAVPIERFRADLAAAGFTDVRIESIGENVWFGFDTWVAQTQYHDSWGRNWLKAYRAGLADYFVVSATN
ncbi:methyltransferase domain-containing protein [Allokutzneria sp. A3M-2-11 16]|uniref:class I SAM-dependent methyltransferase n=1 Tax=Allokutzneria sp. A3M-2-11 16 TaxID=2962043 RepID=UPI0020B6EFC2|nr:class I SAM-dependent methyltransferase [Allokutzneria sp. A3M-2-11 16]MCP3805175.1 methyltransferase domain-containing protein [Allokutzneria sp. A3M-2-11 16]